MIHVTTFGNFMPLKHLAHCTIGSSHNPASLLILSVCIFRFPHSFSQHLAAVCLHSGHAGTMRMGRLVSFPGLQSSQGAGGVEMEILCPWNPSSYCQATKRRKAGPCRRDRQIWAVGDFNNERGQNTNGLTLCGTKAVHTCGTAWRFLVNFKCFLPFLTFSSCLWQYPSFFNTVYLSLTWLWVFKVAHEIELWGNQEEGRLRHMAQHLHTAGETSKPNSYNNETLRVITS